MYRYNMVLNFQNISVFEPCGSEIDSAKKNVLTSRSTRVFCADAVYGHPGGLVETLEYY